MAPTFDFVRRFKEEVRHFGRSRLAGTVALACALGLTLASAGFVYLSVNRLHGAFHWVQHTDHVLLQIANIEKNVLAADSTTHAQIYSGDELDRTVIRKVNAVIAAQVENLAVLVADNPDQTPHIPRLRATVAKRAMASPLREGAEFRRLSTIRAELLEMRTTESTLLQDRTAREEAATIASLILAALTGFLALVLGALAVGLLAAERTHRRHVELDLMHIQRLNLMGLTTMALAHEVNQPLAAAGNYLAAFLGLAAAAAPSIPEKMIEASRHALEQVRRAGKITRRLRNFIEKHEGERTIESPGVIIEDAVALLGTIDDTVKVETHVDADLPCVSVDRIQLQQVLVNLVRNGIEALGGKRRCELVLSAIAVKPTLVRFSVRDNGPGLPAKVLENLFKPFMSTKKSGMGVGLAICQSIIVAHGGHIWAASYPDGGTSINFTLPAARVPLAA